MNFFEFFQIYLWGDNVDGRQIAKIIDDVLVERGMTQKEFCAQLGIQSSAMSMWRKGSTPKPERLKQIEKCLGIRFSDYEKSEMDDETAEVLQWIREDYSYRALFESAKSLTKEQRLTAAAYIERLKAGDT